LPSTVSITSLSAITLPFQSALAIEVTGTIQHSYPLRRSDSQAQRFRLRQYQRMARVASTVLDSPIFTPVVKDYFAAVTESMWTLFLSASVVPWIVTCSP
jgi:hypothetical protein